MRDMDLPNLRCKRVEVHSHRSWEKAWAPIQEGTLLAKAPRSNSFNQNVIARNAI